MADDESDDEPEEAIRARLEETFAGAGKVLDLDF
jgi:hypothetical protein